MSLSWDSGLHNRDKSPAFFSANVLLKINKQICWTSTRNVKYDHEISFKKIVKNKWIFNFNKRTLMDHVQSIS